MGGLGIPRYEPWAHESLDGMNTALVVIDVQDSFRLQPSWADISLPDIVTRTQHLIEAARVRGELVAWVLHHSPGTGSPFDPDGGLCVLQPGLEASEGDIQVTKTSHNAFTTTNLDQQLRRRGITRLRICGIRTEQCVETTTRLASDTGYDVELVADACATHPCPSRTAPACYPPTRSRSAPWPHWPDGSRRSPPSTRSCKAETREHLRRRTHRWRLPGRLRRRPAPDPYPPGPAPGR